MTNFKRANQFYFHFYSHWKSTMILTWNRVQWPNLKDHFVRLRKAWTRWFFRLLPMAEPVSSLKAKKTISSRDWSSVQTLRLVRWRSSKRKKRRSSKFTSVQASSSEGSMKKNEALDYFITLIINSLYGFSLLFFYLNCMNEWLWQYFLINHCKKCILMRFNSSMLIEFDFFSLIQNYQTNNSKNNFIILTPISFFFLFLSFDLNITLLILQYLF